MRGARLFRNDNIVRVFRPFWDSSRSQKFAGSSLVTKKTDKTDPDPYEGNFGFTECEQITKVTVIGAAGRVGRTLSLLLKTCPLVDHLCLFDIDKSVKGVGVDVSHIDTNCSVSYVCGMRNIQEALDAPDVVIIAAGCPTSPNLHGKKLFDKNAPIVAGLSEACARFCPKACIVLITNPINSLLPVVGEVYQLVNSRIPNRKLFGLTTLDVVRANTFVAEVVRKDPNSVIVPVIGGASQETIVPVISQMKPCCKIKKGEMIALTECIKRAEGNLTDCQNCGTRGASTLSTAYAGFRFTSSLVMALKGAENIIECAYVKSDIIPELEYLASPVRLGARGIEHNFGYPHLSDYEVSLMEQAAPFLIRDIQRGKCFVNEQQKKQKKYCRRCTTKKSEAFINACANLPANYCCSELEGSLEVAKTKACEPCLLEAADKKPPEDRLKKCKSPIIENKIKAVCREEDSKKEDSKKNFFLSSLWANGADDPLGGKLEGEKWMSNPQKTPGEPKKVSRRQVFVKTLQARESLQEMDNSIPDAQGVKNN